MADSIADEAVWPRPQIEASRMACADLGDQRELVLRRCRASGRTAGARRASSWRTVPTRHGTHCPQLSSRMNAAIDHEQAPEVDGVVDRQDDARAERGADLARVLEGQAQVEVVGRDEAAGRAAEQHGLQVAGADAAGQLEQLAQRGPERHLVGPGRADRARDAEELRPGRALGADLRRRPGRPRARSAGR